MPVRNYGVSIKYFKDNNLNPYKRVDYEAVITVREHQKGFLMSLDKINIFFNQHEPETISERFGVALSQSLYPVQILIDEKCQQVTGIVNQKDIIDRWNLNKNALCDKYEGEVVDRFVGAVDRKICNDAFIQRSMSYDFFWNLFFHPKYISYNLDCKKEMDLYLAVIPYSSPVKFSGVQEITPWVTDYNAGLIRFSSEEIKVPPALALALNVENCHMQLDVDFDLDKNHLFAMHTVATLNLFEKGKKQARSVQQVRFTMYQKQTT